jgi:hypothetical protein
MDVCVLFSVFVLSCDNVGALRRDDHSSKEIYRLCEKNYGTEEEVGTQQRSVEPLMNDDDGTTRLFSAKWLDDR